MNAWDVTTIQRELSNDIDMTVDGEWKVTFGDVSSSNADFLLMSGLMSSDGWSGVFGGNAYNGTGKGLTANIQGGWSSFTANATTSTSIDASWNNAPTYSLEITYKKYNSDTTDDLDVTIQAYEEGTLAGSRTISLTAYEKSVDYLFIAMDGQSNPSVGSVQIEAIPEPATVGLVTAFGGAVLFIRRRIMM